MTLVGLPEDEEGKDAENAEIRREERLRTENR
jgi:hypothetical protein